MLLSDRLALEQDWDPEAVSVEKPPRNVCPSKACGLTINSQKHFFSMEKEIFVYTKQLKTHIHKQETK